MSRLWGTGFEPGTLINAGWDSTTGTAPTNATSSPAPHSGTYFLKTAAASGNSYVQKNLGSSKTSGTLFYRVYVNTSTGTPSAETRLFWEWDNGGTLLSMVVSITTTGAIKLTNGVTSTIATTATMLTAGTWYRIECRHLLSDTVGELELRLYLGDSTTASDTLLITAEDTLNTNVRLIQLGKITSTAVLSYDDFGINDDAGGSQNTWLGPGKMALVKPDGDTAVTWTRAGGTPAPTNWQGVSELPTTWVDADAWNEDSGTTNSDKLSLSDLPAEVPVDAILAVFDIFARHEGLAAGQQITFKYFDEGGTPTSVNITLTNGAWATSRLFSVNIAAKTVGNLNAFQVGYQGFAGVAAKRVGMLWGEVEWIEAPASVLLGAMLC